MSNAPLVIQRLEVSNFKRIVAVAITPEGRVVTLRGKNAQGKSSVLDAIEAGLFGRDAIPEAPVNGGEGRARITLDLGEVLVERSIGIDRKTTLKITSKNPNQVSTQAWLDERLGARSFDTSTFLRMKPKEQAEALRLAIGIDTTDLDAEYKAVFEERTIVNREVARLEGAVTQTPFVPGAGKPVDVAALVDDLSSARESLAANEKIRAAARSCARIADESSRRIENLRASIVVAEKEHAESVANADRGARAVAALVDPDPAPIEEALCSAQTTNEGFAQNARRQDALNAASEARAESAAMTERLGKIEADRAAMLASAAFPVPNLNLVGDSIYLNGQPISQASQAQLASFQTALWLRQNPGVRVVMLREASLLDAETLAEIVKMVSAEGGQLWMEVVGTEGDGILIEDGAVVEQEVGS